MKINENANKLQAELAALASGKPNEYYERRRELANVNYVERVYLRTRTQAEFLAKSQDNILMQLSLDDLNDMCNRFKKEHERIGNLQKGLAEVFSIRAKRIQAALEERIADVANNPCIASTTSPVIPVNTSAVVFGRTIPQSPNGITQYAALKQTLALGKELHREQIRVEMGIIYGREIPMSSLTTLLAVAQRESIVKHGSSSGKWQKS